MFQSQLFIGGSWTDGVQVAELHDKFSGKNIAEVHEAGADQVARALDGVSRGQELEGIPPHARARVYC